MNILWRDKLSIWSVKVRCATAINPSHWPTFKMTKSIVSVKCFFLLFFVESKIQYLSALRWYPPIEGPLEDDFVETWRENNTGSFLSITVRSLCPCHSPSLILLVNTLIKHPVSFKSRTICQLTYTQHTPFPLGSWVRTERGVEADALLGRKRRRKGRMMERSPARARKSVRQNQHAPEIVGNWTRPLVPAFWGQEIRKIVSNNLLFLAKI